MNLDELLSVMDRAAANLGKLDYVWARAEPMIPTSPSRGTSREYEDLRRSWASLLAGLPPINGWTVSAQLPDIDALGQDYLDLWDIGEPPFARMNDAELPGRELDEYRFLLRQARRRAVRDRLGELVAMVNSALVLLVKGVPRDSRVPLDRPEAKTVSDAVGEIERLLGDTTERRGRWSDLHRHLSFGQGHDWHDIIELDWPSVRVDIEAAGLSESDPLPVPALDLGALASAHPAGGVTTQLLWENLDDDQFERLLFEVLRGFPNYQNVEWLMKTRAPDRGRDLSVERILHDDGGTTRTERVIVQAKHWTRSVNSKDLQTTMAALSLWEPPVVRALIIATTGRFTADAVAVAEKHNHEGKRPLIELWPEIRLETILARRPDLVANYNLRP